MALKTAAVNNLTHHLEIPVRVIMDEFANVGWFPRMKTLIAVLRKYYIGIEIILQNINLLKPLYKDDWVTIEGNCDTTLFLGGKGEDNTKDVSNHLLGKATIETTSHGGAGNGGLGSEQMNISFPSKVRRLNQENTTRPFLPGTNKPECILPKMIISLLWGDVRKRRMGITT